MRQPRYRLPRRGSVGLFGPFPYYSTATRRGTRVSGGCCLPIPLSILGAMTESGLLLRRLAHVRTAR